MGRGSMENEHIYKLVICLDRKGKKSILLKQGPIYEIDKITSSFNDTQELRTYYSEQEETFIKKYEKDIKYLEKKYNKKEIGDITIIDPEKVETTDVPREKIIYNEEIEMFEIAINDTEFEQFLKKTDYSKYCLIQTYNGQIDERVSWLIRKIPKIYDEYATKYNKLHLKTLYKHFQKEKQLLNEYKEMIEDQSEDTTNLVQLEAFEKEFMEERKENQKYDTSTKTKIKTKSKIISGGK